jgi:copper(I)-binding protein
MTLKKIIICFLVLLWGPDVRSSEKKNHCGCATTLKGLKIAIVDPVFKSYTGAKSAAAYLIIENKTDENDELLDVQVSEDLCHKVELHQHIENNGVMQMRMINKITIPAGGQAELKPKHDHIMFMRVEPKLHESTEIKAILTFKNAGKVNVTFKRFTDDSSTGCDCNKT